MWRITVFKLVTLVIISREIYGEEDDRNEFGTNLVTELRNDANLDLSVDEEYEDLRAELLAYHTTLAKLSTDSARRSMMTTPCWQMGGICINYRLCREQHGRYLTQALGCRDKLHVCCFAWNRFKVKDMREHGINGPFPWSVHYEAGAVDVSNDRNSIKNRTVLKVKKAKNTGGSRKRDSVKERNKKEIKKEKDKNNKNNNNSGKNKNKGTKRRRKERKEKDNNKERKDGDTNDENKKRDSTSEKNKNVSEEEENITEDNENNREKEEIVTDENNNKSEKRDNQNKFEKDEKPEDRQSEHKEVESDYYTYEDEEDNDKQKKKKTIARKQLSVKFPTFVLDTDDDTDKTLKSIKLRIPITKNLRKKLDELIESHFEK